MTSYTEQSFFEERISLVPEGKGCANILMCVAVSSNTVFALKVSPFQMELVPSDKRASELVRGGTLPRHHHHY